MNRGLETTLTDFYDSGKNKNPRENLPVSAWGVIQWDWLKERSPEGKTYKRYLKAVVYTGG
ncbi:MAG: hypothetical protein K9N21_01690 [Deltaproteobacteria bacterium]|nr:hypothetical protein [Deltaproteobacteria bacterium]